MRTKTEKPFDPEIFDTVNLTDEEFKKRLIQQPCCVKHEKPFLETGYTMFIACSVCGNKRCPKASDCQNECTNSNEPNQKGSIYKN